MYSLSYSTEREARAIQNRKRAELIKRRIETLELLLRSQTDMKANAPAVAVLQQSIDLQRELLAIREFRS